MVPDILWIVFY